MKLISKKYRPMDKTFIERCEEAISYAKGKHGTFPQDPVKACALLAEESGEAIREANHIDEGKDAEKEMMHEIFQVVAVAYRIWESRK